MKLFSPEAFRAFFLKLMGVTYQELAAMHDLSPRSVKYHVQAIKSSYPDAENFFIERVVEVPESLEEKVKLAASLAQEYLQTLKEKVTPFKPQESSDQPTEGFQPSQPTLLLEAIDRSVSTYFQKVDTSPFEEEKEEKDREKKEGRKLDLTWIALAVVGMNALIALTSCSSSASAPKKEPRAARAIRRLPERKIIRLSQMGV